MNLRYNMLLRLVAGAVFVPSRLTMLGEFPTSPREV
jgi:hypothetical protein